MLEIIIIFVDLFDLFFLIWLVLISRWFFFVIIQKLIHNVWCFFILFESEYYNTYHILGYYQYQGSLKVIKNLLIVFSILHSLQHHNNHPTPSTLKSHILIHSFRQNDQTSDSFHIIRVNLAGKQLLLTYLYPQGDNPKDRKAMPALQSLYSILYYSLFTVLHFICYFFLKDFHILEIHGLLCACSIFFTLGLK